MAAADDFIPSSQKSELATEAGIAKLLATTFEARYRPKQGAEGVKKLDGGTANFIYRVTMDQSLKGSNGVETVIVKHAEDFVRTAEEWHLDARRADIEYAIIKKLCEMPNVQKSDMIHVPQVFDYDARTHTIVIEDVGRSDTTLDLKAFMQEIYQRFSDPQAAVSACRAFGASIGSFLATLHLTPLSSFLGSNDGIAALEQADFEIARKLSSEVLYGRVKQTLESFAYPEDIVRKLDSIAEQATKETMKASEVFTHGDFWTGNILCQRVSQESGPAASYRLNVLDWEFSKPGIAAYDIGQFVAEGYCLYRFAESDQQKQGSKALIAAFLERYKQRIEEAGGTVNVGKVAVRAGAHLIVWTPVSDWTEDAGLLEAVVKQGVEMMQQGAEGDVQFLAGSTIMGGLL